MGIERLKEALEANDWAGDDDFDAADALDELNEADHDEDDEGSIGFDIDPGELESEMKGMKQAIFSGGVDLEEGEEDDDEVEKLQGMMLKLQAVKGTFQESFPKV